jgi:pimeloyl-ACP methyl ester carboxylesterase
MLIKLDRSALRQVYERAEPVKVPLVHIYGGKSELMADLRTAPSPIPSDTPLIEVPEAHHHIMIDQPLALVSAIRALLAAWGS